MQSMRSAGIIAHDGECDGPFGGLPFAGRIQQHARLWLLVPVDDDDLKRFVGDSFGCGDRVGAGFSLNAETMQNLANECSCSLIGGKQEATKGHACTD